jgi:hypothetical protein
LIQRESASGRSPCGERGLCAGDTSGGWEV